MEADQKQILDRNVKWFSDVLTDIREKHNLNQRLQEVESFIVEVDNEIEAFKEKGWDLKSMENIKNEVFFLKYSILELI